MDAPQVNGSAATHELLSSQGQRLGIARASRNGDGLVVETSEGIRRKFSTPGDAVRWTGAAAIQQIEAGTAAETDDFDAPAGKPSTAKPPAATKTKPT